MAFAALISLEHTIMNPTNNIQIYISDHPALISLRSTLEILDRNHNRRIDMSKIDAVDAEIREAAYKLEDMIRWYVFHRSLPPSDSLAYLQIPRVYLRDLRQEAALFFERVDEFEEDYKRVLDNPLPVEEEDGEVLPIHNESATVGLWDQIEKITNDLLDLRFRPETVSLVGMAGIGKTHIAREIARHPLIVQHFDIIVWVNVGPKRELDDILVDIVAQIQGKPRYLYEGKSGLIVLIYNSLLGRRYLIVLDNVWSTDVSDYLKKCLPGFRYGRRFLLTTTLQRVAEHHREGIHQIRFMNNEESWSLLRQNVFAERYYSFQLEKVGRKIAEKCEGLPLLILAVARILCEHEQTEEFWKAVVDEKNSVFSDANNAISKVLYPSYEYLPQNLKACFLYMAVFPQTSLITHPKLYNLWIAEDFFDGAAYQPEDFFTSLMYSPMHCLMLLVSHSVVIICKHSSTETIKSCKLHCAFWHLCNKEARKMKLFHVLKRLIHASPDYIEGQRRLSVQNNILFGIKEVCESMAAAASTVCSLLCTGPDLEYEVPVCLDLVLLKVLDAAAIRFYEFPIKVVKLIRLKYLTLTHHGKLPSSISNLQELQYLIIRHHHSIRFVRDVDTDSVCLPKEMKDEIRDLPEVKCIKLLEESTSLAMEIWEKICDIQQVWSSQVSRSEKKTWMNFWKNATGKSAMKKRILLSKVDIMWYIPAWLKYSTLFPKKALRKIGEKIWDMQQAWSTKLQRDSIGLVKQIWEEMWEIQDVRSKILSDSTFLPKEIWEMKELRYLRIIGRNLPDPTYGTRLPNLSNLYVNAHSCTYSVFKGLTRLKKLGIKIELRPDAAEALCCFKHIRVLRGLESLKCVVVNPQRVVAPGDQLSNLPSSLVKLSLSGLGYGWECISAIASLEYLQVLKLRCGAFQGPEWKTGFVGFRRLKYLLLEDIDLVQWTTAENDGCFPSLERLIIGHCYKLKQLPLLRGLKRIEVVDCSPSVVGYAEQARSSSVEVLITSSWKLPR